MCKRQPVLIQTQCRRPRTLRARCAALHLSGANPVQAHRTVRKVDRRCGCLSSFSSCGCYKKPVVLLCRLDIELRIIRFGRAHHETQKYGGHPNLSILGSLDNMHPIAMSHSNWERNNKGTRQQAIEAMCGAMEIEI